MVLSIHGGPEAQEHPLYHPLYQYLLSRGIAVLATNIRGSTGYGKTYQRLVQRDWGGGDMKDWEHAVKWLHEQDWVDADRIGVYGGSYGGFAMLTCVTRLPDYWAAAVDIVGPSNLITFGEGRSSDVAEDDEAVRGRSRGGRRAAARAIADDVHREREDAAARDPGRERPARREGGVRPAGGASYGSSGARWSTSCSRTRVTVSRSDRTR